MRYIIFSVFGLFFFTSCAFKTLGDSVESIYTDEVVIKPSKINYATAPNNSKKAIVKEEIVTKSSEEIAKAQSEKFSKEGYIRSFSFDSEVKLYIYNFATIDNEELVFFYDKKLPYSYSDLIKVNVKDNFLLSAKAVKKGSSLKNLTPSKKRDLIIKRRKRSNIHEAIEEKINTL